MAWAPIHPVGLTTGAQKSSTGGFESLDPGYIARFLGVFCCGGQLFDRASSHLIDRGTPVAILHLMPQFSNTLALPLAYSDGDMSCSREGSNPRSSRYEFAWPICLWRCGTAFYFSARSTAKP
jgi:hypothetical protein